MSERISVAEAAARLEVRPEFVRRMVDKGRLSLDENDRLDALEVDKLGTLLKRLRGQGVATLVGAIENELGGNRESD